MFNTTFNKEEKLWSGPKTSTLLNPNVSVGQALLRSLQLHGSKVAQISDDNNIRLTFGDLSLKTVRTAQNLQKLGYQPNDVFSFVADNSHHLAPIMFAAFCLGCPVSPLSAVFVKTEMVYMLRKTMPKLMFCDVQSYDFLKECLSELHNDAKIFTFGGQSGDSVPVEELFNETGEESTFIPVEVDGINDVATINCSSGTTGPPKGVCLSHATLFDQMLRLLQFIKSDDVLLCFSNIYWSTQISVQIIGTLCGATRIITTTPYTPERLFTLIEKYRVTFFLSGPYPVMLAAKSENIKNADLSSVKCFIGTGSKIPHNIIVEMDSRLSNGYFLFTYGMTEMGGFISGDTEFSGRKGSVGKLTSGCEVKIIDENGNRLGVGENGELCLKGVYKFSGYYGDKPSTDATLDDEGFVFSGDIGHFDEDGHLYVVDRKKEILKYLSFSVSPSEIEEFLHNCSDIKTACVVGIPDEVVCDLLAAVIELNPNSTLTEMEIYDLVSDHFADYKKLRGGVYFVNELPRTTSGKTIRRMVKEIAVREYAKRHSKSISSLSSSQ